MKRGSPLARILASFRSEPAARPRVHRRFLSNRAGEGSRFLEAAREFVATKSAGEVAWLYRKPYDPNPLVGGPRGAATSWRGIVPPLASRGLWPVEVGAAFALAEL